MITFNHWYFQNPSSSLIEFVTIMHDYASLILISVFMLVVLSISKAFISKKFRFNFFENHQLELIWTIIPFVLLFLVLVPSLFCLYILDSCEFCGLNLRVVGHQWYWSYDYKDLKDFTFDAYMLDRATSKIRLLDVDNRFILISFIPIRLIVTSADVIHSWAIPSLGFKLDAVPGRINQFCTLLKTSGIFFGQCSEICGANHSFIPIVLEVFPSSDFYKIF